MKRALAVFVVLLLSSCNCGSSNGSDGGSDGGTDAGSDAGSLTCAALTGAGTMHTSGSVAADETWDEASSPHLVTVDTSIASGVTLRLTPCAVVRIAPGKGLTVRGTLVAEGTQQRRVTIERQQSGAPWATIQTIGGTVRLTNTTVQGGGDPLTTLPHLAAMLDIRGDQTLPTQGVLLVDDVELVDSASQGVKLSEGGGFFPASNALRIRGSTGYPIHTWSRSAGTIPAGDYADNGTDELLLSATAGAEAITEDVTLHDRGVPYRVGHATSPGTLHVGKGPSMGGLATLTIEAGVTLRFKQGGVLFVEASVGTNPAKGALIVQGTQARHVVFTSAQPTPAAGDWRGIWFGQVPAPSSRIDFAEVDWAGQTTNSGSDSCPYPGAPPPNNDAAIRIFGRPASAFITNTGISHSAHHGIDRGYRGPEVDFLPTNSFDVAGCKQTQPKDMNGMCPATVPCP